MGKKVRILAFLLLILLSTSFVYSATLSNLQPAVSYNKRSLPLDFNVTIKDYNVYDDVNLLRCIARLYYGDVAQYDTNVSLTGSAQDANCFYSLIYEPTCNTAVKVGWIGVDVNEERTADQNTATVIYTYCPAAHTSGWLEIQLTNIGNAINNGTGLAENVIGGVKGQGDLIGLAIGIAIACGLLLSVVILVTIILRRLVGDMKKF